MDAFRCDVLSAEQLCELAAQPLPLGLSAYRATPTHFRDVYLDTPDDSLRQRGITCRLRASADDRHTLTLRSDGSGDAVRGGDGLPHASWRVEARVRSADPRAALAEHCAPARRLRALTDPARVTTRLELEVDRLTRYALPDWLGRARLALHYDDVTVRREGASERFQQLRVQRLRGRQPDLTALATAFRDTHGLRAWAVGRGEWDMGQSWGMEQSGWEMGSSAVARAPRPTPHALHATPHLLDSELSLLAFQERVLTLAEDPDTPLRERMRFLAIIGSNLDEFFVVRIAGLKLAAREQVEEHTTGATEEDQSGAARALQLVRIAERVSVIAGRQSRALDACLTELARHGVRVRRWRELEPDARARLREQFCEEMNPALTPLAMTLSPGHPLPHLAHLALSVAVLLPDRERGGAPHFADVELPVGLPRFIGLASGEVVPLEEVLRGNLDVLFPDARVDRTYCFRVTRAGELDLDESAADDLLEAVHAATQRRPWNAVVRVEVERAMPLLLRELLLEKLRSERHVMRAAGGAGAPAPPLEIGDVYGVDGLLDLRALDELPYPARPELEYPPFRGRTVLPPDRSVMDVMRERDLLLHHPFDDFDATVGRFLREAARDPAVVSIKATLYRVGDDSPVVHALLDAARRGKEVAAIVELKARFDEERNVAWARALEAAGGHVVYGLVGLKNHAKVAMVVRRETSRGDSGEGRELLRRYVHAGTGNYNARSARQYTDLSLLSADAALTQDVGDLFNDLTGAARTPRPLQHGALVAPAQILPTVLEHIEREAAHARAGGPGSAHIRLKLNGLSDAEVVAALYRASQAGVQIDLVVRGICTLRPGVPGLSERIRVMAVVGRFLEHSRIYYFANAGEPRWYIGSSDLRPRNLRRRVELLVPIRHAEGTARLDRIFETYWHDPSAWELRADGEYVQRGGAGLSAQQLFLREVEAEPQRTTAAGPAIALPDSDLRSPSVPSVDR